MSEMTYSKCPLCNGTLRHANATCPCVRSGVPGWAPTGVTLDQLERLVDSPPTGRRLVGMCDCGQILYAAADRAVVQCKGRPRSCGATWDVERSQDILMDHLDGQLVTAAEAAHLGGFLDTDRTQEQIRKLVNKWAERGQLAAHGHI